MILSDLQWIKTLGLGTAFHQDPIPFQASQHFATFLGAVATMNVFGKVGRGIL